MKISKGFFKIVIALLFVIAVPIMVIGANFWILGSQELMHNCLIAKNTIISFLPCGEIANPIISPLIQFLGFLIMLVTAYTLYKINDCFRRKF